MYRWQELACTKGSAKKTSGIRKKLPEYSVWWFDGNPTATINQIKEREKKAHNNLRTANKTFSCRYVLSEMWWTMICILYARNALNNNNKRERVGANGNRKKMQLKCTGEDYPNSPSLKTEKSFTHHHYSTFCHAKQPNIHNMCAHLLLRFVYLHLFVECSF